MNDTGTQSPRTSPPGTAYVVLGEPASNLPCKILVPVDPVRQKLWSLETHSDQQEMLPFWILQVRPGAFFFLRLRNVVLRPLLQ